MNYLFCPYCGAAYEDTTQTHLFCNTCGRTFWQNSKPTASTVIVNDQGQILLGKRAGEPMKDHWDVIGGFLEPGEDPEAGAIREAKEETGYNVKITSYLGIFTDLYSEEKIPTLNIAYLAKIIDGTEKPQDDIAELKWFDPSKIPENTAFQNGRDMIEAWKQSTK